MRNLVLATFALGIAASAAPASASSTMQYAYEQCLENIESARGDWATSGLRVAEGGYCSCIAVLTVQFDPMGRGTTKEQNHLMYAQCEQRFKY